MRIRTIEKLSETREMTPEGYLLCKGAALARIGVMRYLPEDVEPEIMAGSDSEEALLYREEKEVFDPGAMASFEGKPLTIDHPDCDVAPENWQELARGMILNVRRGLGKESDLLLGDILVTDSEAIDLINSGMRELSCGYDTKLEVISPGVGRQTEIRGNHVALVEKGRAGARCCIKDKEKKMGKKGFSLLDDLKKLMKNAESEEAKQDKEEEASQTATDNAEIAADLQEIKLMLRTLIEMLQKNAADSDLKQNEEPAKDEEAGQASDSDEPLQDEESKNDECAKDEESETAAKDSLPSKFCDSETAARAQRMGLSGARIGDSADAVYRGALGIAMRDADTARICRNIMGDKPLAKASVGDVRAAFLAVSAIQDKARNTRTADALTGTAGKTCKGFTPAAINKMNKEFYGGK